MEKPSKPKSQYVNTGLWMFLPEVFNIITNIKKSPRGEFEMTDVLSHYAKQGLLTFSILKSQWTDAGSFESLYKATVLMKKFDDLQNKRTR
jgi:glucose-1-phosphate thymidylyltransferase